MCSLFSSIVYLTLDAFYKVGKPFILLITQAMFTAMVRGVNSYGQGRKWWAGLQLRITVILFTFSDRWWEVCVCVSFAGQSTLGWQVGKDQRWWSLVNKQRGWNFTRGLGCDHLNVYTNLTISQNRGSDGYWLSQGYLCTQNKWHNRLSLDTNINTENDTSFEIRFQK